LTTKKRRLFKWAEGAPEVRVIAKGQEALPFVLLHESTHVVDASIGISRDPSQLLIAERWKGSHDLKEPYASSLVAKTAFRGKDKIAANQAESVYDAMQRSPFVSLYSTAAASEDLAELIAWYEEGQLFNVELVTEISIEQGKKI
jgi:hypothetical protein